MTYEGANIEQRPPRPTRRLDPFGQWVYSPAHGWVWDPVPGGLAGQQSAPRADPVGYPNGWVEAEGRYLIV
jgi:hypothetical protein